MSSVTPRKLETNAAWMADDVQDPAAWTVALTASDHAELDAALAQAKAKSDDLLQIGREDFPLDGLARKLADVERELIDGRGFVRLSRLDRDRYDDDEMTMLYWGVGMHLGEPWPQNKYGHVMGDVTDHNKPLGDPTLRGNEIGLIALDYHTDGSDLVGLMCLRPAKSGGLSCVANIVAIYNRMVDERPDLVAALFDDLPWDFRGEEPPGGTPFYLRNVFTEHEGRLFCRFVPQYIRSSQRHDGAPRLSPRVLEALEMVSALANQPQYNVYMDLQPGEMQFINNYHVLHGRTAYEDDVPHGIKRHLKRLWLSTRYLTDRPPNYARAVHDHWDRNRSVSRVHAAPAA
jgi:hypothetical protein